MWNIERSFQVFNNEEGAKNYWEKFKTSPEAEKLREFTRNYCGKEWTKRILGI
jgi:hypothetical protein